MRLNSGAHEFVFRAEEDAAKSWHELLSPGVLRARDNELTLSVDTGTSGQVIFSEIVILYTSNRLTVTRPIVLDPG